MKDNICNCTLKEKCGGCHYMGMPYAVSISKKQEYMDKLFKGLVPKINPVVPAENPYFYRNKVYRAFTYNKQKRVSAGTFAEGGKNIVIPDDCYIEDQKAKEIIKDITAIANRFRMSVCTKKNPNAQLRGVLVRVAKATGEIMVVIILGNNHIVGKKNFINEIKKLHPEIKSIYTNVNRRTDSMILDLDSKLMKEFGKSSIKDVLLNNTFEISPESFYQVNRDQAENLYTIAMNYAEITPSDTVIDAYCGIGTITLTAAKFSNFVYGVDSNKKAISDAIGNARKNAIKDVCFVSEDATEYMEKIAFEGKKIDVIIMDPPRAGSTERFIEACRKLSPRTIVYVSCNPETLARDLKIFSTKGYKAKELTPVDMFPFTDNIETVCLLSKLHVEDHIYVDLDMEEIDVTKAEKKASYEKIREYVKYHTGLIVSNLNIAQIKRKFGIIERDCYNLPKSENSRQPNCTPEKEKAIIEALGYFKMI